MGETTIRQPHDLFVDGVPVDTNPKINLFDLYMGSEPRGRFSRTSLGRGAERGSAEQLPHIARRTICQGKSVLGAGSGQGNPLSDPPENLATIKRAPTDREREKFC